jgi:hypothetical protein
MRSAKPAQSAQNNKALVSSPTRFYRDAPFSSAATCRLAPYKAMAEIVVKQDEGNPNKRNRMHNLPSATLSESTSLLDVEDKQKSPL